MDDATPRAALPPEREPVHIVQEAGWATVAVRIISPPTGIRSPDRPARSESLYRLSDPGPFQTASNNVQHSTKKRITLLTATADDVRLYTLTRGPHSEHRICISLQTCSEIANIQHVISPFNSYGYMNMVGARGGVVVKALRYKPAGRGFDSRWCHWNFSVP